jgi:hypothetical protein
MKPAVWSASIAVFVSSQVLAQSPVPVTVDNFVRAESDLYMGNAVKEAGGTGRGASLEVPGLSADKSAPVGQGAFSSPRGLASNTATRVRCGGNCR